MVGGLEPVPGRQLLLQALYRGVYGFCKPAAGGADKVVVVRAGTGRLVAGHAVSGYEFRGLAAAAEELERPVNGGYADARQPLPGLPVHFFSAQVAVPGSKDLQYSLAALAVPDALAGAGFE